MNDLKSKFEQNVTGRTWEIETDDFRVFVTQNVDFHNMTLKAPELITEVYADALEEIALELSDAQLKAAVMLAGWAGDTGKVMTVTWKVEAANV